MHIVSPRRHVIVRKRSFEEVNATTKDQSLTPLSLRLKLKQVFLDIQFADLEPIVIHQKLDQFAQELVLLQTKGMETEQRCIKCLRLAQLKMESLIQRHHSPSLAQVVQVSIEERWALAKQRLHDTSVDALEKETEESAIDEIDMLLETLHAARQQGIAFWHLNQMQAAIPYLVTADRYTKRILRKKQQMNISHALLDSHRKPVTSTKTTNKKKKVSFNDSIVVMGCADEAYDRRPIPPTKPSKLEILLIRSARDFAWYPNN